MLCIFFLDDQISNKQRKLKKVVNIIKKIDKPSIPDSCKLIIFKLVNSKWVRGYLIKSTIIDFANWGWKVDLSKKDNKKVEKTKIKPEQKIIFFKNTLSSFSLFIKI